MIMTRRRVALVTGGAKGIGKAIVEKLAEVGFSVAVNYNTSEQAAFEIVAKLQSRGVNALAIKADVSDFNEVKRMYDECRAYFGFVDTLVNNAGISLIKPLYECVEADFDRVIAVDLKSVFNTCRIFTPDMTGEGFGRIVNVSSVWGEYGGSTETLYSAAKAGVIGFTKALNAELARGGVIVNSVSPGFINTSMNAELRNEDVAAFLESVSVGRVGSPEEVAEAVEFLTRENLYVAGANISVNGGIL